MSAPSFPRRDHSECVLIPPETYEGEGALDAAQIACRDASVEWLTAATNKDLASIDEDCFKLAVCDRALELIIVQGDRNIELGAQATSVKEWRSQSNGWIQQAYYEAKEAAPSMSPPDYDTIVYPLARAILDQMYQSSVDSPEVFAPEKRKRIDVNSLGRFKPPLQTPLRAHFYYTWDELDEAARWIRKGKSLRDFKSIDTTRCPP